MQCDETNSHMVTAGRSYFDLISGYSRSIICRSYFRLQQADHISILFRVIAGRSYIRTRRNVCVTADKTTMAAGKINYGCFEMFSWPHRTSNNINICFWLLETCTKCSCFIEETWDTELNVWHLKWSSSISRTDPQICRGLAICGCWASFQTTGTWCVNAIYLVTGCVVWGTSEQKKKPKCL